MEILTAIDTGAVYGVFSDFEKVMEARSELNKQGIKEFMHSTIDEGNVLSLNTIKVMKKKPRNTEEYLSMVYGNDYKVNETVYEVVTEYYCGHKVEHNMISSSKKAKEKVNEKISGKDKDNIAMIHIIQITLDTDERTPICCYVRDKYHRFVKENGDRYLDICGGKAKNYGQYTYA